MTTAESKPCGRGTRHRVLAWAIVALAPLAASTVSGAEWTVDMVESALWFETTAEAPNGDAPLPVIGRFGDWSATVRFDPARPAEAMIDVAVALESATTGDARLDRELRSPDWFDVSSQPQARYHAIGLTPQGSGRYRADGTLSLKGIDLVVPIDLEIILCEDRAQASGSASVTRLDFGVGRGVGPGLAGADVQIRFRVAATQAGP